MTCWGHPDNAALGDVFTQYSLGGFYAPNSGRLTFHTCGLKPDQTIACWGMDRWDQATPPEGTFTDVQAGGAHSCAKRTTGEWVCWGENSQGQLTLP